MYLVEISSTINEKESVYKFEIKNLDIFTVELLYTYINQLEERTNFYSIEITKNNQKIWNFQNSKKSLI